MLAFLALVSTGVYASDMHIPNAQLKMYHRTWKFYSYVDTQRIGIEIDICIPVFTAPRWTAAKSSKQLTCPWMDGWMDG